jgi:hypothetical protein
MLAGPYYIAKSHQYLLHICRGKITETCQFLVAIFSPQPNLGQQAKNLCIMYNAYAQENEVSDKSRKMGQQK